MRGRFDAEDTLADLHAFNVCYKALFGEESLPCFLMGDSMGGTMSTFLAAEHQDFYKGAILNVPYFGLYDSSLLERIRPMIKMASVVSPDQSIPLQMSNPKAHLRQWIEDPMNLGN